MTRPLIADRRFAPIFWTQSLGALNGTVLVNALAILIGMKSQTMASISVSQAVALCGSVFILPFFLFSAAAGQLADKVSKSRLIVWVKVWELAVMILAVHGLAWENLPILLTALFLTGLQATFFGPVKYSILPHLLEAEELVSGTARVEMGTFLSVLVGTVLGGVLIGVPKWGPWIVGSVMIACALLGCIASTAINTVTPVSPHLKVQLNPFPAILENLNLVGRTRSILSAVLGISWFWFQGCTVLLFLQPYCKEFLRADESVMTLFLALFSIGIALGSLLCGRLSPGRIELGMVPLGAFGMSLFSLDMSLVGCPEIAATTPAGISFSALLSTLEGLRITADLFLFSVAGGLFIVPLYTLLQQKPNPEERSRIIAGNNIVNSLFMVIAAMLLAGLFALGLPLRSMILVFAVMNLAVGIHAYRVVPEFFLRFICWIVGNVMYRLQVIGRENIPAEGPAILVSNHVSFVDWMIISSACPRPVRFVMHYKFLHIPVARRVFRDGKVIPIAGSREDPEMLRNAFARITQELNNGQIVCLFPEGRITRDGNKRRFRPGVEWIVQVSPVPVIPVALNGLWGSFFSRKYGRPMSKPFQRFWSRISVVIGKPVPPDQVSADRLYQLVSELQTE